MYDATIFTTTDVMEALKQRRSLRKGVSKFCRRVSHKMPDVFKKGDVVRRKDDHAGINPLTVKGVILAHPGSRQVSCVCDEDGAEVEIPCRLLEHRREDKS